MVDLNHHENENRPARGIYLLPNLFTVTALFAGFYAIVWAMEGRFENSVIAIFVAMVMDGLDGRIARMTHTQTAFGAQLDSLSDMVSFGLAPAVLVFSWALMHVGRAGWLGAFLFMVCVALRLARFNIQLGKADKRFFIGLPSPAGAALIASMVWVGEDFSWHGLPMRITALIISVLAGLLMVSNIHYRSFKDFDVRGKVPFIFIVLLVLIYVLISIDPPEVLFAIFAFYSLSGPAAWIWEWHKTRRKRKRLIDNANHS